jgi:hypothetical protein
MKRCRWSARCASRQCASSLSSPMPVPCGRYWITSVNPPYRRASHRHAGRRCGRRQWLRSRRATILNGICRCSLCRSSTSISASLGDEQFCSPWMACAPGLACAGFWRWRDQFLSWELTWRGVCHGFDDENRIGEGVWGKVNLTCVVEFPILLSLNNKGKWFVTSPGSVTVGGA